MKTVLNSISIFLLAVAVIFTNMQLNKQRKNMNDLAKRVDQIERDRLIDQILAGNDL